MNHFRKHVPVFVDTDEYPEFDFETTEDLLAHPEVARFKHPGFSHFAISGDSLIAIYKHGFEWWCAGFITDPSAVNLPQWDGGKYAAIMPDGTIALVNGRDVMKSSSDVITLRDGRQFRTVRP